MEAVVIQGGIHKDSRGIVRYVNEENPGKYRRFYLITHPDTNTVRAWQGHKIEEKAFYVITGSFIIAIVNPAKFEHPDENERPVFYKLTDKNHSYLRVPGGNYTGIKALSPGSTLLVLSSLDLTASKNDDFRQPLEKWVDWDAIKNTTIK